MNSIVHSTMVTIWSGVTFELSTASHKPWMSCLVLTLLTVNLPTAPHKPQLPHTNHAKVSCFKLCQLSVWQLPHTNHSYLIQITAKVSCFKLCQLSMWQLPHTNHNYLIQITLKCLVLNFANCQRDSYLTQTTTTSYKSQVRCLV